MQGPLLLMAGVIVVGVMIGLECRRYFSRVQHMPRPDSNEQFSLFMVLLGRFEAAAEDRPLVVAGFRDLGCYTIKIVHPSDEEQTTYIGMGPDMETQRGRLILELNLPFRRLAEDHVHVDRCLLEGLEEWRFYSEDDLRAVLPVLLANIKGFRSDDDVEPAA